MKLLSLTPNLMVRDVNAAVDFYTGLPGFELLQTVPESGVLAWAMVRCGGVSLMLQKESSLKEEYPELKDSTPGGTLTLYIRVENMPQWYDAVRDKVRIVKPPGKTFYGANEFAIMDNDGYILTFSDITE